jgi:hypothetical protein
MGRDADTEARDLKSNALIARDVAINRLIVEGAESFALRALATALRAWLDCGGVRDAPTRSSRYDRRCAASTQN